MKKSITYIALIGIGLFLGWLFFGTPHPVTEHNPQNTAAETNTQWTCAMHPQIKQPEKGDCPICGMALIPVENETEGFSNNQFKLSENAIALANIQTTIVKQSNVNNNTISVSGVITENEDANSVQVSYFSGNIEQLNVSAIGQIIKKGQLIASIYSPELYAAQQELITAKALKTTQPRLYAAVRNKLNLWKLSEKQINQIETSGKVNKSMPIYATVSGTVTKKLVEQGDYIKAGQQLLKIANLNSVWASFDVYEHQIDQFKKGQNISISTNANPNKVYIAKINFIDPALDVKTRTIKIRAVINNKDNTFKPGMFVEGQIKTTLTQTKQPIRIPASSVLWTGKRSIIYIKTNPNEPIFEMHDVVLGNKIGEFYEILEGLDPGDEIVTHGTFTVDATAQLRGKKSMMHNPQTTINFGVRGNCGMCKITIESAVKAVEGVFSANWDIGKKNITVTYDALKTTEIKLHKAIAAKGYDTEKVKGHLEAYKTLAGCCQYNRNMPMHQ